MRRDTRTHTGALFRRYAAGRFIMSRRDFAHFSVGEICRSHRRVVAEKPTHLPRRNGGCNATFIWILYFSQNICGAGHNSASPTQPKQWRQQQQHQRVPKGSSTCARIYVNRCVRNTHTHELTWNSIKNIFLCVGAAAVPGRFCLRMYNVMLL